MELEEFVATESSRGFTPEEPLLKSLIIPSKDPKKIFVYLNADHTAADGSNLSKDVRERQRVE